MNLLFWTCKHPTKKSRPASSLGVMRAKKNNKKRLALFLCFTLLMPHMHSAQAGVFDPLLKIILPFYKSDEDNKHPTTQDTHSDIAEDDEPVQLADDGNDEYYEPNAADLPSVLFDDTLLADDSEPMLGAPDLYALLSAEFSADRGDVETALAIYKAESFKQNATAVFERALSLSIEYDTPAESLAFATAWQAKNPDHTPAWFYVTHLALKARDYNQAVQMLAMILEYDSKADLSLIFGSIFPNNPVDQRELFYALQNIDSINASVAVLRAGLLMRLDEYDASLLYINDALKAEPKNLAFINLKLDILSAANRMDELWKFLHAKRRLLPKETSLYLYEIRHLINMGNLKDAWQLLLTAHKNTQDPDVILLSGLVGIDIGEYQKAVELLTPLTKNTDFASQAHYYLGIANERLGDLARARYHYERVKNDDFVLDARTKVVGFYLLDNNVSAAMSTLVRLRDEYEIYAADSYILQAEIHLRQGDIQSARDILMTANRQYPDDDRLLFTSYQLLENDLDDTEKRLIINHLLSLDEHNPNYQLASAKLALIQNPNDEQALATAQSISTIRADDPLYDKDLQLEALIVLSENALVKGDYKTIINLLQAPYEVSLDLDAGILLLRAYQGLGDDDTVQRLLTELQNKYDLNQDSEAPTSTDTQSY